MKRFINYFIIIYLFFLISLFSSWAVFHVYEGGVNNFSIENQERIKFYASIPGQIKTFVKKLLYGTLLDSEHTIINNNVIKNGFTVYDTSLAFLNGMNLLVASYSRDLHSNEICLIDLDAKKIKYKWVIPDSINVIRKRYTSSRDCYHFKHPLLYDDTSIIATAFPLGFNKQCLIKINKYGNVDWILDDTHHSIELDADQNIWVCGDIKPARDYSYIQSNKIPLDAILKIEPKSGRVLYSKNVFDIFHENKLDYLMSIGQFEADLFHINDIQPALHSTNFWQKGDLLISLRHRNTILLFRPSTNKVIWFKTGPWSNQHDCDFLGNDKILVFGNDMIRFYYGVLLNGYNNAYIYDLSTGLTETPFTKIFKSSSIATVNEGRCDMLPADNIFIEDTENGIISFGDSAKIKLTYSQRENKELIRGLHWSRIIPDNKEFP